MNRVVPILLVCAALAWLVLPLRATVSVNLTVQEAIYSGGSSGVARTDEPVTVGIPLPNDASTGADNISDLTLTGASAGQFRVLGCWSGTFSATGCSGGQIKWVLVDTLADLSAGGTDTGTALTSGGGGNFGGSDLATDNGSTITVATGACTFTIREASFNGLDTVVCGSTTLVTTGHSGGLQILGPTAGNTACGTCATTYSSASDASSTVVIEENGPVRAVLLAEGSHKNGSDVYTKFKTRMHFYKGTGRVKIVSSIRNAEYSASDNATSAFKEFLAYEFVVPMTLSGTMTYVFGTHSGGTSTSTLSGTDDAYIYQAENSLFASDYAPVQDFTTDTGYDVRKNGSSITTGSTSQPSAGWGNCENSSNAGVLVGHYQASGNYPKGITFNDACTSTRVGIHPTENTGEYYVGYPQYDTSEFYLVFHDSALSSNANEFLKLQHFLIARAPLTHYNDSGVFGLFKFIDSATEDAYYNALDVGESPEYTEATCCLADVTIGHANEYLSLNLYRRYSWNVSSPSGQIERRWSELMRWLIRGMPGRYLNARHFYGSMIADAVWRSDGFSWLDHPSELGTPGGHPNLSMVADNNPNPGCDTSACPWNDPSRQNDYNHVHWYGVFDYYFMTGDEGLKDAILDGFKDHYLAPSNFIYSSGDGPGTSSGMQAQRGTALNLSGLARFATFLQAIGDADESDVSAAGETLYEDMVKPELCLSDPGSCDDSPFDVNDLGTWTVHTHHHGTSRLRGWNVADFTSNTLPAPPGYPDSTCGANLRTRVSGYYFPPLMAMGLMDYADYRGTSWADYYEALDLAYGGIQALDAEQWHAEGNNYWHEDGYRYSAWLDRTDAVCYPEDFYDMPHGQQTFGMAFYMRWRMEGALSSTYEERFKKVALKAMFYSSNVTGTVDYASAQWNALIYRITNPGSVTLQDVSFTPVHNGGGNYTLTWTPPSGAQSYRVKWDGKAIADMIGFNAVTNSWTGNPATTMTWFGANNVSTTPTCGGSCSVTFDTGNTGLTSPNFSVKAYADADVESSSMGGPRLRLRIRREQP